MIRRPPRSTPLYSSAASDVYKRQHGNYWIYCHAHGRFERAKLLTVAVVDLSTGRTFMVGAFPYAVRKMLNL